MNPYRVALLALFVSGALVVVSAGATLDTNVDADADAAIGEDPHAPDTERANPPDAQSVVSANDTAENSSLGAELSSFMQSNTVEVGGAVETVMWTAAFDASQNRSRQVAMVERRTTELRSRLADLERREAELVAERDADNVSETAYKAKVSRLVGQIDALRSAINATSERAERVDAEEEALESLRTEAENLTGPAIAAVARNLTSVGDSERGPPVDRRTSVGGGDGAETATTGPSDPGSQTTADGTATEATVDTLPTDVTERVGSTADAATVAVDPAAPAIPA